MIAGQSLAYRLNILAMFCMLGPLVGALGVQWTGDLPCPLCLLERLAMFAVIIGLAMNLRSGLRPLHYGLSMAGALAGAAIAGRQVLLHINDPAGGGYGGTVLGMHLYTWALVVFVCFLAGTAVLLMIPGGLPAETERPDSGTTWNGNRLARTACYLALAICGINAILAFMECGFGQCPDNPTGYWIFGG